MNKSKVPVILKDKVESKHFLLFSVI